MPDVVVDLPRCIALDPDVDQDYAWWTQVAMRFVEVSLEEFDIPVACLHDERKLLQMARNTYFAVLLDAVPEVVVRAGRVQVCDVPRRVGYIFGTFKIDQRASGDVIQIRTTNEWVIQGGGDDQYRTVRMKHLRQLIVRYVVETAQYVRGWSGGEVFVTDPDNITCTYKI